MGRIPRMTTTPEPARQLGIEIKRKRDVRKMSLGQLSRTTAVPKSTLVRLERGLIARPRLDLVATIAVALNVAPAELFALLGCQIESSLPLTAYLHARYHHLSPQAIAEMQTYLELVAERDGIDLHDPPGLDQ